MPLPSKQNNPFWPLCPDYAELSDEGKRQARLQLLCSWYDPAIPNPIVTDPEAFVYAFRFFKEYYRRSSDSNKHKYFYADAPMHSEWPVHVANNPHLILTSFRGSAKSAFLEELAEFVMLSRPHTPVLYGTSAIDLAEQFVRAIGMDLRKNDRVIMDFGEQCIGKPLRWTMQMIELPNGSALGGVSSEEVQRGKKMLDLRAFFQILDDPEVDKRVANPELRSGFEDWLFNVFFAMSEPFAWRLWFNTLLSPNAWAVKAINDEDPEHRFIHWKKIKYDIAYVDASGKLRSTWPAKYPDEHLELMAKSGGQGVLGFGKAAFLTEFMNQPTHKAGLAFNYDPRKHTFKYSDHSRMLVDVEQPAGETFEHFCERSVFVASVDLALGFSTSDPSAIVVAALDDQNCLYIFDLWEGRADPMQVLYYSLDLAEKWRVAALGIERITFEKVAIDLLQEETYRRSKLGTYTPDILELKHGGAESKAQRALAIQWRFRENKIKLIENKFPELENQLVKYTVNGAGTAHDDLVDALVGCQEVLRKIPGVRARHPRKPTVEDQIRQAVKDGVDASSLIAQIPATRLVAMRREEARKDQSRTETDGLFHLGTDDFEWDPYAGGIFGEPDLQGL